jgi:hypothetical protein
MAEVYRARDTRLGRDIALKVVNESLAGSPELARRFEQEARLAGSLNHPNVVAVYDVGLHEGIPYFVTELLQGELLRHRLSRGRIPLQTALDWAAQIAHGLSAAHAKGVIHRDVKPDNVFLSSDGHVKLLDFGIAKLLAEAARDGGSHGLMDVTVTPTGEATRTGSLLGTPGYMSPEQVRGEPLDARTDIFSFGAVVHEMLSGKRAFPGGTLVESGSAILNDDSVPLPENVPPAVVGVVRRCLEKDREQRFQSARDVGFALDAVRTASGAMPLLGAGRGRPIRRRLAVLGLAVVGVLAAVVAAFVAGHRRASMAPQLPEIDPVTFRWGTVGAARFLPDGRVVFGAGFEGRPQELFVRSSGSPTPQSLGLQDVGLLAASRMGDLAVLVHPRVSVHWATRQGTLARVPSVGGIPRELAENAEDADWSPGGDLAVVRQSGAGRILEVPPGHALFRTNGWISNPRFSPKGDWIAFLHHPVYGDDMGEVVVTDLQGQSRTLSQRWPISRGLAWSADGREVWFTGGVYWNNVLAAVTLGGKARDIYRSVSEILLEDVGMDGTVLLNKQLIRTELVHASDAGGSQTLLSWTDWNVSLASLSADGRVLFSTLQMVPPSEGLQPYWVMLRRTDGTAAQVLGEGIALDLSPDGRWALVRSTDSKMLTALPTGVGEPRSIPTGGLAVRWARWMADGRGVLAIGRTPGEDHAHLYRLAADASTPVRVSDAVLLDPGRLRISSDGRWAAAVNEDRQLVVISVQNGATHPVPQIDPGAAIPCGWSPQGNLWVTEGVGSVGARTRLLRLDPRTGQLLEERNVGPVDPGGASLFRDVVVSPDGRHVAFTYVRDLGQLVIMRGLGRSAN